MTHARVPPEAGDCFFAIRAKMSADPSTIAHPAPVTLRWKAEIPAGDCPPLEWLIHPGWIPVEESGELVVRPFSDTTYTLYVTAKGRTWHRTIAAALVERIYKPPRDATSEEMDVAIPSARAAEEDLAGAETTPVGYCVVEDGTHNGVNASVVPVLTGGGLIFRCSYGHNSEVVSKLGTNT